MGDQPIEPVETSTPETVPSRRPWSHKITQGVAAVFALAFLTGLIYWRHSFKRQEPVPESAVQSTPPEDLIFADENQLQNLTIESVSARDFTIDREVAGKIELNENLLTPVFPAYSGRVIEVFAAKGEAVRTGQKLLVVESPDYVAAQIDL